ncbi:UNVERIFIED_CONTAM: hypothetical protein GTU68_015936 [Idotea baltica]|nr:hypothetical protein [Idotea baltica]
MRNLHNRVDRRILLERLHESEEPRTTISFYKYAQIGNVQLFRDHLFLLLESIDTFGRIYVAHEGINGQISVPSSQVDELRKRLYQITFLEGCRLNIAIEDDGMSFYKLIIKIRKKIVADGIEDEQFDVTDNGKHINAEEYNSLVTSGKAIVIDMRNHYEHEVGHFKEAIRPDVETFRESLPIVEEILEKNKDKEVVMYCTGGIRCEKATAYFKYRGFDNLHQLDGGIIEYSRQAAKLGLDNHFLGKNFVFDDRLGERISSDVVAHCHQCGSSCDAHTNCANDACHLLFIQCPSCGTSYDGCCSKKCADFNKMPPEEQAELRKTASFNGSKFGKGRYKAARSGQLDAE